MKIKVYKAFFQIFLSALIIYLLLLGISRLVYGQTNLSDAQILAVLNKGRDNIIEKHEVCIERPVALKGIVIVGTFAHDRGCRFDSAFVNGKRYIDEKDATKAGLKHLGWLKINKEERENLALSWTKHALLKFSHPLEKATAEFDQPDTKKFEPPKSTTNEDGSVKVILWIQQPAGMQPITYFDLLEYSFGNDASFNGVKTINSFNRSNRGY
jgi:hypothetical protein